MAGYDNSRGRSSGGDSARRNFGGRSSSSNFNKRTSPRGGGDFRRGAAMEKTTVICADCGKKCEVPFKPTSNKPVYCSDCFRNHDDKKSSGGMSADDLKQIHEKLDKILDAINNK